MDRNAYVYQLVNNQLVAVLAGDRAAVTKAVFGPDSRQVVTAGEDGTARIWDPGVADQLRLVRHVSHPVTAFFSPAGRILDRAFDPRAARTADSADGRLRARADGKLVVVSDRRTGRILHRLPHDAPVTSVAFSPGGKLLATGTGDPPDEVRIWVVRSGTPLHKLVGHFGAVVDVSFSPDGRWLVSAGPSAAILWNVATGERIFYLRGHRPTLTSASFSPDSRRIVTASTDGTVRVYDCEVCGGLDSLIRLAERRLTRLSGRP
jgi:WD40 repeat protein